VSGRGRPQKRDDAAAWLKAYLSGGRRPMKDIERVGLQQGYGLKTIQRAKSSLGFKTCPMPGPTGFAWGWRDPSVIEPNSPDEKASLEEKMRHRLDTIERLAQEPKAPALLDHEEQPEPIRVIPLDRTDELGYLVSSPSALGLLEGPPTVTASAVLQEISRLAKTTRSHEQIVAHIFDWAYPAAGLPESVLAMMLKHNHVAVPNRAPQKLEPGRVIF